MGDSKDVSIEDKTPVAEFIKLKFPDKSSKWDGWVASLLALDFDTVGDIRSLKPDIWDTLTVSPVLKNGLADLRPPASKGLFLSLSRPLKPIVSLFVSLSFWVCSGSKFLFFFSASYLFL